jgi:hypothetical protein
MNTLNQKPKLISSNDSTKAEELLKAGFVGTHV